MGGRAFAPTPDMARKRQESLTDPSKTEQKALYIKSYGCQMNVYDSQRMCDILTPLGYRSVNAPDGADLIILNTCHIREKAAEKVYSELGRLRALKKSKGPGADMVVAVAGCVAQAEGQEILARAPMVDMVFGPQTYHRLPDMLARLAAGEGPVLETDFAVEDKFDKLADGHRASAPAAFLTIQEGCDKFCTFCVVPYTRGAEFSRPVAKIEAEARALVASGAREITLLGQNVNAYHGELGGTETMGLGALCRRLADIDGLERIRYTTSHPRDMDEDLISAHGDLQKLMPYLHLPVQSGSDAILASMNRGHTSDHYRALVGQIRARRPDIALSSDFIVGFPGETDKDFKETLRLIEDVHYAQAFSFKYSPRPGTPGATMDGAIDEQVKSERLGELQALLSKQQAEFNKASIGKTMTVLFEKTGRHPGQIVGRSPYLQAVYVGAPEALIGTLGEVEITQTRPNSLAASLLHSSTLAQSNFTRSDAPRETRGDTVHG